MEWIVGKARAKFDSTERLAVRGRSLGIEIEEEIYEMSFELWVRAGRLEQTYKKIMWDLSDLFKRINDVYKLWEIPAEITVKGLEANASPGGVHRTWVASLNAEIASEAIETRRPPSNDSQTKNDDLTGSDTEDSNHDSDPSIQTD